MKIAKSLYLGRKIKEYEIIEITSDSIILFNDKIGQKAVIPIKSLVKPNLDWLTYNLKFYI